MMNNLRNNAEAIIKSDNTVHEDLLSSDDMRRTIHELRVHKIELEMQCEEILHARQALEDEKEMYFDLYDLAPVGYITLDGQGAIIKSNLAFSTMMGMVRSSFINYPITKFIHRDDLDAFYLHSKHPPGNGTPYSLDVRLMRDSGVPLWVSLRTSSMKSCKSVNNCSVLVAIVIDELRQAKIFLQDSEDRFQMFMENLPGAVFLKDNQGKVIFTNKFMRDLFGWSDPIGQTVMDLFPPEIVKTVLATDRQAMIDGHIWLEEEFVDVKGQTRLFDTHKFIVPLSESTTLLGEIGVDITSRRRSEIDMRKAKEAAELANTTKSEFLANMSHEIRTPLNGVLGMLQLMEMTPLDDEQKEYVFGAIKSTQRLTHLLSDILDLSRMEAGKLVVDETEFDIKSQKDSVVELFSLEARKKGLYLDFVIDEKLPAVLIGDGARLRQVLFNLVGNSIKFTKKGYVRVEASLISLEKSASCKVLFTVKDTGIGIPDDRLKNMFDPFVQGEDTYIRNFQGAGLGLSIVHRLIALMNGEMSVDNSISAGTTFYFSLPFKVPKTKSEDSLKPFSVVVMENMQHPRILLAEDDAVAALIIRRILGKLGYTVTAAGNGKQAVSLLSDQDFDLILMDVQMPLMDGVETTKAIRNSAALGLKSKIPIIAMTAYAMTGDREKIIAAGVDDYIAKPVERAVLTEVIQRVLAEKYNRFQQG